MAFHKSVDLHSASLVQTLDILVTSKKSLNAI